MAFSTKDRVELSRRTIQPLLQPSKFDTYWVDGSVTDEGKALIFSELAAGIKAVFQNIRGGADAAIVHNLTMLLNRPENYAYVGLVENDVLLPDDWYEPTMALFEQGRQDGLNVGAVSARCYEDRILCRRDGYAVVHNLGAGMVIYTREAAQIVLNEFRTTWTTENRKTFALLSGVDIGAYWAFRGGEHWLCADWGADKCLARHRLASLALLPSHVEMIGQVPSLEEQGLRIAKTPLKSLQDQLMTERIIPSQLIFERIVSWHNNAFLQLEEWQLGYRDPTGTTTVFPHQVPSLGGAYAGDWRLKWTQGYGPFSWRAGEAGAYLVLPMFGPCAIHVGGGANGATVEITDTHSNFRAAPALPAEGPSSQILVVEVPGSCVYRVVKLRALAPGVTFYALTVREPQPRYTDFKFDYSVLPPVAGFKFDYSVDFKFDYSVLPPV